MIEAVFAELDADLAPVCRRDLRANALLYLRGRQYSGTMGRVENVIVAMYCTCATSAGHALTDRGLCVQADWFADPERMAKASFPPRSPQARRTAC